MVGNVTVTGRYSGPIDLEIPNGYELLLSPDGDCKLLVSLGKLMSLQMVCELIP